MDSPCERNPSCGTQVLHSSEDALPRVGWQWQAPACRWFAHLPSAKPSALPLPPGQFHPLAAKAHDWLRSARQSRHKVRLPLHYSALPCIAAPAAAQVTVFPDTFAARCRAKRSETPAERVGRAAPKARVTPSTRSFAGIQDDKPRTGRHSLSGTRRELATRLRRRVPEGK